MSENLKIDVDRNINRNIDDNIINVIINIKDTENLIDSNQKVNPSFFTGQGQSRVILLLIPIIEDELGF